MQIIGIDNLNNYYDIKLKKIDLIKKNIKKFYILKANITNKQRLKIC